MAMLPNCPKCNSEYTYEDGNFLVCPECGDLQEGAVGCKIKFDLKMNTVTWYDFAVEILKDTNVSVKPVDSSQFPAKAKRPLNSTMSLTKAKATGFVIPTWQEALEAFYKQGKK